jgi:peptide chain release factor subunit 1
MLSREELKELTDISENGNFYVTLYLNVNPTTNQRGEYVTHLKNLVKETEKQTDKNILKKVKKDFEKIESFINTNKREFKKGLVIISSQEVSFWRTYHLSIPVKNLLVVDKTPFINPLLDIIDNYPRYLILLIEKEFARLFIVQLSEITEYVRIHTPDVPGKHKKGGWFALAETHYQRHIDYHVEIHLKEVEKTLEECINKEKIDIIFIGGHEEVRKKFINLLPQQIKEKIHGEFNAQLEITPDEVLKKVSPLLEDYERQKERKILDTLITKVLKGDAAVMGLEDTLNAVMEGRVHTLIFDREYRSKGYRCEACGFITVQEVQKCPYCSSIQIQVVEYLVDFIAQKAVEQGAKIEVIAYENGLMREKGGIGAILRY